MAKILIQNEWYNELSPKAIYETEFENIVTSQGDKIFPDYFVVPFKTKVYTDDDIVIPDLALIDKNYRDWWVVEIEMNYHSFDDHILPQVIKLTKGYYGKEQSDFLCSHCHYLNKNKIYNMMKGKPPQVLVIVNKPMPDWAKILTKVDTTLCVVEVFRSELNKYIFRLNGEYPSISDAFLTVCYPDPIIPRFMVVESPASLPVLHGGTIKILFNNCITEWERIDGQNRVWLSPVSLNPLPRRKTFVISRQTDGTLMISIKE